MIISNGLLIVAGIQAASLFLYYPTMHWPARFRLPVFIALWIIVSACPFIIVPKMMLGRGLAGMFTIWILVKAYDLEAQAIRGKQPSFPQFLQFSINGFWLVIQRRPAEMRLTAMQNAKLLIGRSAVALVSIALCIIVFKTDWTHRPFVVEHIAKVCTFYLALMWSTNAAAAAWRLAGGIALDPFDDPALARTPGQFWRGWNRPAAQFFHEHVFNRAGGRRHLVRATLVTFAVSALIHEYLFCIALGRPQGFQLAFFMLQGFAVIVTLKIHPRGRQALLWTLITFAFELAVSVLFFASVNHVLPFYSRPLPGWLGAWDRATS